MSITEKLHCKTCRKRTEHKIEFPNEIGKAIIMSQVCGRRYTIIQLQIKKRENRT